LPSAIELIVAGYVKLGNKQALVDLIAHRERILPELEGRISSGFDFSRPIRELKDDIRVASAGLEQLRAERPETA
jgi:hypothetical protein